MASTSASGTGLTGAVSRAAVRPIRSPSTDRSPSNTAGGTNSSLAHHLKNRRMRLTRALVTFRDRSRTDTMCSRTAFSFFGPNWAAGRVPYNSRTGRSDAFTSASSCVGSPSRR